MIKFTQKGDFAQTSAYLQRLKRGNIFAALEKFGEQGVAALAAATPAESGLTANSWSYEVVQRQGYFSIRWRNSHIENGRPIAVLLRYGHGTRQGAYVQGRDYIGPAIRPIFDQIVAEAWKEVTK